MTATSAIHKHRDRRKKEKGKKEREPCPNLRDPNYPLLPYLIHD